MKKRMLVVLVILASLLAVMPVSASEEPTKQEVMPLHSNPGVFFGEFGTDVIGVKLNATADFDGAYIYLANSGTAAVLNCKVFAWNTDYATSAGGTALVNQDIDIAAWRGDDHNTRAETGTEIKFNKTVEAGEYLITFGMTSGNLTHSINMLANKASGVEFFRNGGAPRNEWDTIVGGILYKQNIPTTVLWGDIGGGDAYFLYGNDAQTARSIAVRFNALNAFKQLRLGINGGDKLTYTLYSWKDDYATTVAGTPVKTVTDAQAFVGSVDATVDLGGAVAKGEYLLVVKPASETPSSWLSVWTKASKVPALVDYYCDGVKQEDETTETQGVAECALYRCIAGGIVYVDDTVATFGTLSVKQENNTQTGDRSMAIIAVAVALASSVVILLRRKCAYDL